MIDNPLVIAAAYFAGAAVLSVGVARFSPIVKRGFRHIFSAVAPLAVVYGGVIARDDVVILDGGDILFSGGLVLLGLTASIITTGAHRKTNVRQLEA